MPSVEAKIRAYARRLDSLLELSRKHDARALARLRRAWKRFRADALARIPGGYELTQAAIPSVLQVVAAELDSLTGRIMGEIKAGMGFKAGLADEIAARFGRDFLDGWTPVATAGAATDLLDIAAGFSADLIGVTQGGLSSRVLAAVNRELHLAVLGVHAPGPFGAMGALGKALQGVRGWIYETERIYRTEVNRVYSLQMENQLADLRQFGPVLKRWRWSGIAREEHARIDGQTVPLSRKFRVPRRPSRRDPRPFVLMRFPRDPLAPGDATINCGCHHHPVPGDRDLLRYFDE